MPQSVLGTDNKNSAGVPGVPSSRRGQGRFEGALSLGGPRPARRRSRWLNTIDAAVDASAPTVAESAHLDVALDALTSASQTSWIPVVDNDRAGSSGRSPPQTSSRGYRLGPARQPGRRAETAPIMPPEPATSRITAGSSPVGNIPLRHAGLPDGVIVTSIQRGRDLLVPDGDTVLQAGDRLAVIGAPEDVDVLTAMASDASRRRSTKGDP